MQRGFSGADVALMELGRRLREWRERHGGRGRRVPEEFWREAVKLAEAVEPSRVARALGLRADALTRRLCGSRAALEEVRTVPGFIEITPVSRSAALGSVGGGCRIEVSDGSARRVALHFADFGGVDLVALAHGLLETRS